MFALFPWPDHAQKLNDYFSSKHTNMNFSLGKEEYGHLPSLVIGFFHENEKFATNVYRKRMLQNSVLFMHKYTKLI